MDGVKRKKLSIIMDNCVGQNKNNYVLRLASYLVRKGYFSHVQFVFLVVGHTKNAADRFFNALKAYYRFRNVFFNEHVSRLVRTSFPSYGDKSVLGQYPKLGRISGFLLQQVEENQIVSSI